MRPLPVHLIKENIDSQLQASRDIFKQIERLTELADRHTEDQELTTTLVEVMQNLLNVGKALSSNASKTGKQVLEIVGVNERV
jgi:hypothetical protein